MEALSDSMMEGSDLQLANHQKANRNVFADRSLTISKIMDCPGACAGEEAGVCFVLTIGVLDSVPVKSTLLQQIVWVLQHVSWVVVVDQES